MSARPRHARDDHRTRVGFLNSHPIQYAAPLYAYLNRSPDIEPVAIYLTDFSLRGAVDKQFGQAIRWDIDLLAGYEHHFVGRNVGTAEPYGFFSLASPAIGSAILRLDLDALVLHGHNYAANLIALAAARAAGIPVFYKAETHLGLPRSGIKSRLRPATLKTLFSQMAGFLAIGTKNAAFYRSLGIADAKIHFYPYTVDNDRFVTASALTATERASKRAALGLSSDGTVMLYASKLTHRKHPDDLLAACQILAREGRPVELLFVGTGELNAALQQQARSEPTLPVHFAGFVNQTELPAAFAAADVFVLPSEDEPWGLIFNEAMCAGLPVVGSEEIGCVGDLVRPGENGAIFNARDVGGLVDALRPLVCDQALRRRYGERSRQIIDRWSYAENLAGLRAALVSVGYSTATI
ncbi:MAG: glycosyltransferase family 4 protein [Sphingomonas sp.]|uniref:glycosyltransferase family 4 protein n=1 Tax=Sphingomonas sp. TaxID=28214 RepID=UPI001ACD226A|nr:glycosyltransferase family 4 protein [Sphingomonas sp.]MBN8806910.1 glycosyltransferase family 4 protein [Sphingomonas sp.]